MGKSICSFENRLVVKIDFATKEVFLGSSPYLIPTWKGWAKKYTSEISVRVCRHLVAETPNSDYVRVAQIPKLDFSASRHDLLPKNEIHTFRVVQYAYSQIIQTGFEEEALEELMYMSERPIITTERVYIKYPATWWDAVKQEISKLSWMSWVKFNLSDYPHEVRYVKECTTPGACFFFLSGTGQASQSDGVGS